MTIGLYAKAIAGAAVAGLTAALTALEDGTITGPEWAGIVATTLVGLAAVWAVPNLPAGIARYGKAGTAAVVAGLGAAGTALTGGALTTADWIMIAIAVITSTGLVYTVPNADRSSIPAGL